MNEYLNRVKQLILERFRETKADVGHIIPPNWIITILGPELNPKEKAQLQPAIQELVDEGLVELKGKRKDTLALTQKGVDHIY